MNSNTTRWRSPWCAVILLLVLAAGAAAAEFPLNYSRLDESMNTLTGADRMTVDDAIRLIKAGNHSLALSRLYALGKAHPDNSSIRILASYALVLTGNLVGAFERVEDVHDTKDANSYSCWFLAKIALVNGKTATCVREIQHVKSAGMIAEADALEEELRDRKQ